MLTEKELKLNEKELREQVRSLSDEQQKQYHALEARRLKSPRRYALLNWLMLLGVHHFYLRRWGRGLIDVVVALIGLYLIVQLSEYLYGSLMLLAVVLIELPQLFYYRHIVHNYNNHIMAQCLQAVNRRPL